MQVIKGALRNRTFKQALLNYHKGGSDTVGSYELNCRASSTSKASDVELMEIQHNCRIESRHPKRRRAFHHRRCIAISSHSYAFSVRLYSTSDP